MTDFGKILEKLRTEGPPTIKRNDHVLIVDGMNTYIRAHSANPSMDGLGNHVGGIVGFLKSIGSFSRQHVPSRIIICFDGVGGNVRRRALLPEYKEKRKMTQRLNRAYDGKTEDEEKESMMAQLRVVVSILENLPITMLAIDNIEADDSIAYLTSLIEKEGGSSIIYSSDKDFLQLVGPQCKVYNPVKKIMYDEVQVMKEFSIHPKNFLLYRCLDGDTSDNISGVKGIALKTLLKNFPEFINDDEITVEELTKKCEKDGKFRNKACQSIVESQDIIERNIKLMDLKNVDISLALKMVILKKFEAKENSLNKIALLELMRKKHIISHFGNYEDWIFESWVHLTRYTRTINE